jgi:hypothetical protein
MPEHMPKHEKSDAIAMLVIVIDKSLYVVRGRGALFTPNAAPNSRSFSARFRYPVLPCPCVQALSMPTIER